jgi:hypothetical protein
LIETLGGRQIRGGGEWTLSSSSWLVKAETAAGELEEEGRAPDKIRDTDSSLADSSEARAGFLYRISCATEQSVKLRWQTIMGEKHINNT